MAATATLLLNSTTLNNKIKYSLVSKKHPYLNTRFSYKLRVQCEALFRPCINIYKGKVKEIVASTLFKDLNKDSSTLATNFESDKSAEYASLYKEDRLTRGHVNMLGADSLSKSAVLEALHACSAGAVDKQATGTGNLLSHTSSLGKGPSSVVTDLQRQSFLLGLPSSFVKKPSKPEKQDQPTTSKEAHCKWGYDPDLFFKVNGKLYQRLEKIGSGGSSEVYKVMSSDHEIFALKKVKLRDLKYATAYGFCQEIQYLNKLKGKKNIIQLIDYEVTDESLLQEVLNGSMSNKDGRVEEDGFIYMVLEYGEIDLAHILSEKRKENSTIDDIWLRFYGQQILQAVNTIHEERIVHTDLKPANFLLVKGSLKLIDFGIAKAIMNDTTNIQRDAQVGGTLDYMSPEALTCNYTDVNGNIIKRGRPSDIWSIGCIFYQMAYGQTPFSDYTTFWAKVKVITDPNHNITYEPVSNPWLLDLMKKCLAWDRNVRWRIPDLLKHPFLVTMPSTAGIVDGSQTVGGSEGATDFAALEMFYGASN